MSLHRDSTFSDFKKSFYKRAGDPAIFDCGDINILKVVLDGLKVNYASKGKVSLPFFKGDLTWKATQKLKKLRAGSGTTIKVKSKALVLAVDLSGRSVNPVNEAPQSYYFKELLDEFPEDKRLHVVEHVKESNYVRDIDLPQYRHFQHSSDTGYDVELRTELLKTVEKLRHVGIFNKEELINTQIAVQNFFLQYKTWKELLKNFPSIRFALVEQHYHHEGLLLALKKAGIRCYEIQHGLIAESDIFYVFPKSISAIRNKALFPDKILVYGDYWKNILLKGEEFAEENIVCIGDFRKKSESISERNASIEEFCEGHSIILISSQTYMSEFYKNYAAYLSKLLQTKHAGWKILLKLHPNEKENDYNSLSTLSNILVSKENINHLFGLSQVHISVYSTTLYEALEYDLLNLSLQHLPFKDYTDSMVRDRIALPIGEHDDPVEIFTDKKGSGNFIDPKSVFADFSLHKHVFKALFN